MSKKLQEIVDNQMALADMVFAILKEIESIKAMIQVSNSPSIMWESGATDHITISDGTAHMEYVPPTGTGSVSA